MESDDETLRNRVMLLEETATHQSLTIDELSGQIAAQWTIMDQMRAKLDRLTEQFRAIEDLTLDAPANSRPPHY